MEFREIEEHNIAYREPASGSCQHPSYELWEKWKKLDKGWFREHGVTDPILAVNKWQQFKARNPLDSQKDELRYYKEILQLATGLGDAAIRHYLAGRLHHISLRSYRAMAHRSKILGYNPPTMSHAREDVEAGLYSRRIALLSMLEVSKIPSPPYHMEVIRGIVNYASRHNFLCSLHEVSQKKHSISD